MAKEISKMEKFFGWLFLWIARAALAVLAVAGMTYFLGGIDDMIRYPVAIVTTAFLLKEVL